MNKLKPNYIIIPAIVLAVGLAGRFLTKAGMGWYKTLQLPAIVPPSYVFPIAWNLIYLLVIFATVIIWNTFKRDVYFWIIIMLLGVNALLNVAWSYFFFYRHDISHALIDAVLLNVTVLALIIFIWPRSSKVALLFVPYALWVGFAIVMNWQILLMNS